jgi:hypothetical protein
VTTPVTTSTVVSMVFSGYPLVDNYRNPRRDYKNVEPNDLMGLVRSSELPGVVPRDGDLINRSNGQWLVITQKVDPAGVVYTLQLRRS